ncbi:MAG TPA: zinc ABC transporter substrate-binding protein [Candidatus Coprovivens excrementavium]|nr:zinc ABC transporter substrate-binding protein [Candidatus Coprovivens excrementavium]
MKKKIILLFILCIITLTITTGCNNDKLEGSNITTTIYPIEYLVNVLYGDKSNITSIYPNDTDVSKYELTEKQLNDYSKSTSLFVYNGLSNEKEIAKTLINKNSRLQIIDASYGLKYKYGIEELWLNPNNYLMLANTIKDDLKNLSSSKYSAEQIEENYNKLEESLTTLDAELRTIAKAAIKNNNETIIIAYNSFGFLEKYGFKIINISSENNITSNIKNKFKDKTYTKIFVNDTDNISDSIKDIVDNYDAELIEINTMATLTDKERSNGDNYLTIMNDFITKISDVVLE